MFKRLGAAALIALAAGPASAGFSTPEAAVAALWSALSHDEGQGPDTELLETLFSEQGVVFGSRVRGGGAVLERLDKGAFIARLRTPRPYSFHECEVRRRLTVEGRFAAVESLVTSTRVSGGSRTTFAGINSIQLYGNDAGWSIVSLYYHVLPDGYEAGASDAEGCLVDS